MLAYYVAVRLGLPRPYWAVITSYLIAQPFAGAVFSKSLFRLLGTAVGAAVAVALVPTFANEPTVLSATLSAWLALCIFLGALDRTPKAYAFLLAGFTAIFVGCTTMLHPGSTFDTAVLRVEEIIVGICAGSLVHGVVFPRTVTKRVLMQASGLVARAERSTREAISYRTDPRTVGDRLQIAVEIGELGQLAGQLPFDLARLLPRGRVVRALQDRLFEILPLAIAIEDRMAQLVATGGVPEEIESALSDMSDWLDHGIQLSSRDARLTQLLGKLSAICDGLAVLDWRSLLTLNVCTRLADLLAMHRDAHELNKQLHGSSSRAVPQMVTALLERSHSRDFHRDPVLALRSAAGAFIAIFSGFVIWIQVGWPDGAIAVINAAICCALFSNVDRPGSVVLRFFKGSLIGSAVAVAYAAAILPRVATFEVLGATIAPPLLLAGALMARPGLTVPALGGVVAFLVSVGFDASFTADFSATAHTALALLLGVAFAAISMRVLQTVDPEESVARLFHAGWRDVAHQAEGSGQERHFASRMIDRVSLLIPRLGAAHREPGDLLKVLADMRTGVLVGRLYKLSKGSTPAEQASASAALEAIGRHFRSLDFAHRGAPPQSLLDQIDQGLGDYANDPEHVRRNKALVILTSLRRDLFSNAPSYRPAS